MSRNLFKEKNREIKKKKQFLIAQVLHRKIDEIERRAEIQGVSFPIDEHIEDAIKKLIRLAESQLGEIERSKQQASSLNRNDGIPTA